MHVSQWAADESAALAQQAQQADSRFAAREYGAAIDGYQQVIRSAGQLQARARDALGTALAAVHGAFQSGVAANRAERYHRGREEVRGGTAGCGRLRPGAR